jgi:hypothetical protein
VAVVVADGIDRVLMVAVAAVQVLTAQMVQVQVEEQEALLFIGTATAQATLLERQAVVHKALLVVEQQQVQLKDITMVE